MNDNFESMNAYKKIVESYHFSRSREDFADYFNNNRENSNKLGYSEFDKKKQVLE